MIKSICIQNVKGIINQDFLLNIQPKKISILVAPNGFGKSSFATAFDSLNRDRLKLRKDDYPEGQEHLKPSVSVNFDDNGNTKVLLADDGQNQIKESFDVFVINSNLFAKTKQQTYNGQTVATSDIEVEPVVLISTIPVRKQFEYSYQTAKTNYGTGNVLPNLSHYLSNTHLFEDIFNNVDFKKYSGKRMVQAINSLKDKLRTARGNINEIKTQIELCDEFRDILNKDKEIGILSSIKKYNHDLCDFDSLFIALQIIDLYQSDLVLFKDVCKYYSYCNEKEYYDMFFSFIDTTWKDIKPKVDVKKGLIVSFPKVNQISNGQRDFINFISLFLKLRKKISKPNTLLIIDEVFDYLDDSNLISAQYFVSKLFKQIETGTNLYPIILTHLNPYYFNNYRFQKPQIRYLSNVNVKQNKNLEKIIIARKELKKTDEDFNKALDAYYFHYHPDYLSKNYSTEFQKKGFHECYNTPEKFRTKILTALHQYIEAGEEYDVISICCATRVIIEEYVYKQLKTLQQQEDFVNTYKTDTKLDYALEQGVVFPEVFNLLGVIYNEAMHLENNVDKITPIGMKLHNKLIKQMIEETFNICQN